MLHALARTACLGFTLAVSVVAQDAEPVWSHFFFHDREGDSGVDLSIAGGQAELVFAAGSEDAGDDSLNRYWFLLRHDPTKASYLRSFVSPFYPPGKEIRRIAATEFDPAPGPEILVARDDGPVEVWSQAQRRLIRTLPTSTDELTDLAVADVDLDGKPELLLLDSTGLLAHDSSGKLLWQVSEADGPSLVVAQMDSDPTMEIACSNGCVVDAGTRSAQWIWLRDFGDGLCAVDIDADGMDELISTGEYSDYLWAFDVDRALPKWSRRIYGLNALELSDMDGDGTEELVLCVASEIQVTDPVTGNELWAVGPGIAVASKLSVGDANGDGVKDIIWGGGSSTGVGIVDGATKTAAWRSRTTQGSYFGPRRGDIDGDGQPETLAISSGSETGYSEGRFMLFDGPGFDLSLETSPILIGTEARIGRQFELVDANGDGDLEVLMLTTVRGWGDLLPAVFDFDPATRSFKPGAFVITSSLFDLTHPTVGDVDKDGNREIVLSGYSGHTGHQLVSYDLQTGIRNWYSDPIQGWITAIELAETDLDPAVEMHVLNSSGDIHVLDGVTHSIEHSIDYGMRDRTAITTTEFAGQNLLLAGDNQGGVEAHLQIAGPWLRLGPFDVSSAPIRCLEVIPGTSWMMIGSDRRLTIFDGITPAWRTAPFDADFGDEVELMLDLGAVMVRGQIGFAAFQPR